MKINELTNLYIGYNEIEDFRVLICALDRREAQEIAMAYMLDNSMQGSFEIKEFENVDTHFDCDYVLAGGQ